MYPVGKKRSKKRRKKSRHEFGERTSEDLGEVLWRVRGREDINTAYSCIHGIATEYVI